MFGHVKWSGSFQWDIHQKRFTLFISFRVKRVVLLLPKEKIAYPYQRGFVVMMSLVAEEHGPQTKECVSIKLCITSPKDYRIH